MKQKADHVVALVPEGEQVEVLVAPPSSGRPGQTKAAPGAPLSAAVLEQLQPIGPAPTEPASKPWYASPVTWLIAGGLAAGATAGVILLQPHAFPPSGGSITVRSP